MIKNTRAIFTFYESHRESNLVNDACSSLREIKTQILAAFYERAGAGSSGFVVQKATLGQSNQGL